MVESQHVMVESHSAGMFPNGLFWWCYRPPAMTALMRSTLRRHLRTTWLPSALPNQMERCVHFMYFMFAVSFAFMFAVVIGCIFCRSLLVCWTSRGHAQFFNYCTRGHAQFLNCTRAFTFLRTLLKLVDNFVEVFCCVVRQFCWSFLLRCSTVGLLFQ